MDFNLLLKDPDKTVRSLVRKLTHDGQLDLDKQNLTELRKICKATKSDLIPNIHDECIKCLCREHSQVRVSTVKLMDYLFKKSHLYRIRVLEDFDLFLQKALGLDRDANRGKLKLPPPKKYATLLQELSAKVINSWHSDYGKGYEKLRYAYKYLREHQLVDFSSFQVRSREDLINRQKLAERQERILDISIENRLKELQTIKPEVEQLLAKIESLIDIIVHSDDIPGKEQDTLTTPDNIAQNHGIANLSQSIEIEFSPFIEIEQNSDTKETVMKLKEFKKELIEGKLTKLIDIEKTLTKRSEHFVSTIRNIIELKGRAMNVVLKLGELKIINELDDGNKKSTTLDCADSDSDELSEYEEVQCKDDLESYIPKSMRKEYGLDPIDPRELNQQCGMTLADESFDSGISAGPSSSVPTTTTVLTCNFRLETGKLCPRRDKLKCPFHGIIIPRDHHGEPINEQDRQEEERKQRLMKRRVPEWQDPHLLAEIRAATGVDLTIPSKKSRAHQTKLLNAKTCDMTPKQRLEKRLRKLGR